ncbi:phage tail tape measure protein [Streptomyces wedmorensis]|uniref:phage tail tape measure protein n=1 Tax=Streptomyces wedmorensis TaxID=43759 RepID=UPI003443DCF0
MNIQVRVAANQAQAQLRALGLGVQGLNGHLGTNSTRANASTRSLMSWGNQVQWTGRQIQTNWTLPLLAAGAAAFQWQMENERAFTRIAKVYGSAGMAADTVKNELKALEGAFEALSNHYGVHQKEVLEIAGDWAAAGASGIALARGVEATLQTMVLGELKATEATQALIAIQAQYGEDTKGLTKIIATLNMVENETGVSMAGLIKGFQRSAGVARSAGVDYRHLAAMIAGLTPAAGSAAEAGNALKTIFSRLASPTGETAQVLGLMGINLTDLNWKSANAVEQLQILSGKFEDLSDKQKEVVSTVVASRWQINKFSILMRELASDNGYYAKSLRATADDGKIYLQFHKELQKVMSSNPQRMQQIWVMLQNAMTNIIQPLIPIILYLANAVRVAVTAFSNMDPALQKLILFFVLAIVAVGPLLRYIGSLVTLVMSLGAAVFWVLTPLFAMVGAVGTLIGAAWGALIAAITGVGAALLWLGSALGIVLGRGFAFIGPLIGRVIGGLVRIFPMLVSAVSAGVSLLMAAISTAITVGGAVIAGAWAALMFGIQAIFVPMGRALLVAWRGMMLGFQVLTFGLGAGLAAAWRIVMVNIQIVMIAGARVLGMIWRAMTLGIAVTTMTWGQAFARLWLAIQMLLSSILLATARTLGVIWRGALAIMTAITTAWRPVIASIFAAGWAGLVAIARLGGTALALAVRLPMAALVMLVMLPLRLGVLFKLGWMALVFIARWGITGLFSLIVGAVSAIGWPIIAAIALVVVLVAGFWDELKQLWNNAVAYFANSGNGLVSAVRNIFGSIGDIMSRVFNKLPNSVKNAMLAVVSLVAAAARKVYELFSYINPFAHHSPSLVENVTNGMAEVRAQFATLSEVEKYVMSAYRTIAKFGGMANSMANAQQEAKWSEQRTDIKKVKPSALPAFDAITNQIRVLTPILQQLEAAVNRQQRVVDAWKQKLDAANASLDKQQSKLDALQKVAQDYSDQLDAAKQKMEDWASTPIQGQQAMSDAIFNNTMAQKKLQLEMMKIEDATGPLDDIKSKMNAINGEMDTLRGLRSSMQQGGAGSEILKVYDDQMKALQGKGSGLGQQADKLKEMREELDKLERKGQQLDLENSLKFDPLTRQIENATKSMKEMPFDTILAGIASSKAEVEKLTGAYDAANEAVKKQQAVVDAATAARDAIQSRYDAENEKLRKLKDAYDAVNKAVQDLNSTLEKMTSYASDALQRDADKKKKKKGKGEALSPGARNFLAAEGGNFADVGKDLEIGREGGLGDQSGQINDFTKDLANETSKMFAGLNPLTPLKKWWDKAWNWLKTYIGPLFSGLGEFIGAIFSNIPNPFAGGSGVAWLDGIRNWVEPGKEMIRSFIDVVVDVFGTMWGWLQELWGYVQPLLAELWDGFVGGLKQAWDEIWPEIAKFKDLLAPIGEAFSNVWTIVKPILALIAGALGAAFLLVIDIVKNTIGPLLQNLGEIIGGVIRVIRGVIEFLVGVFTLDWDMAWQGIVDIFGGVWDIIVGIVDGAWDLVWGILTGAIEWIGQVFALVWDKWIVPAWDKAWGWIRDKAGKAWDAICKPFIDGYNWISDKFSKRWEVVKLAWELSWKYLNDKASYYWNLITKPFKDAYNWIVDKLAGRWEVIKLAWELSWKYLRDKASYYWNLITKPFKDIYDWLDKKFGGAFSLISEAWRKKWEGLVAWFKDAAGWIVSPLKTAINGAIGVVNKLIEGLNKVADILPGLDWNISLIPKFAAGGGLPARQVGAGFRTTGARAIVGEGNPNYPEYVIPTDPTYKRRAMGLFGSLARDLGVTQTLMAGRPGQPGGIPMFEEGGILGSIKGALGSAGDFFSDLASDVMSHVADGAATYVIKPFFDMANPLINKIPWKFAREMARAGKNKIVDWITFADDAVRDKVDEGGSAGVPGGKIKDWIMQALRIIKEPSSLSKGIYNIIMHESGGNPRAINLWDSNAKAGIPSKGLMQTIDPTFNAYSIPGHKDIWNPIDNIIAGTRYAISRYGRPWLQAGGNRDKNGNYIGYEIGGILGQIPSLAEGALIRRKTGGTLVRVGEGLTDEAVVPLPGGIGDLDGKKEFNFYGDLTFPNVRSGDDAKRFLENLESLTAGG